MRTEKIPPKRGRKGRASAAGFECFDELGENLVDVADYAQIGNTEDRGFFVLVDGDDVLRALHPHHVLRGSGDTSG